MGRDQELSETVRLLAGARLVTLTGVAGVGKTHLALQVARNVASDYPDGAWLVNLADLGEGALIPEAIALALFLRKGAEPWTSKSLAGQLRSHRTLLVLDSCEHLIDACATLAATLLTVCPGLRILATSREPLGVPGEAILAVATLSVPSLGEVALDVLYACESVQVFVCRAAVAGFVLTPDVAPAVADICRRLDGLPLAIELAAARVGMLSPQEIAARLDDRFRLLTNGSRTAPARHKSLQAALDWGHSLLTQEIRVLFRRLSVFAGGCTIMAVEDVCAGGMVKREHVLDLLAELVTKSLVVPDTAAPETRYSLLETIRQYAGDKLAEAGEEPAFQAAFAEWCCNLAERAELETSGPSQENWLARLDAERTNIRAALGWSLANDQSELALRLAVSLSLFWLMRGHALEGLQWIERALATAAEAPTPLRAKAHWGAGLLAAALGNFGHARHTGKESLALAQEMKDVRTQARALGLLGMCSIFTDPASASVPLEQSVALARQEGDTWTLSNSLGWRGFLAIFRSELGIARSLLEECIAVARSVGNLHGLRIGLLSLGYIARQEGNCQTAEALLKEGLATALKLNDPLWTAVAFAYLADMASLSGHDSKAQAFAEDAVSAARDAHCPPVLGLCLTVAGRAILAGGDPATAQQLLNEAMSLPSPHPGYLALALLGLAQIAFAPDEPHATQPLADKALAVARDGGGNTVIAQVIHYLGWLARATGNSTDAWHLHYEALALQTDTGDRIGALTSLEAIAGIAVEQDRWDFAIRLFAATQALRDTRGIPRRSGAQTAHEADTAVVRGKVPSEQFEKTWVQGTAMSFNEAVAYANRRRGTRRRPRAGWASLTPTEIEVVHLVAEGLTNPEIGERLFVSRRTAQTHLSNIFRKLDIRSRKELTREAARRKI
ncbi:MAG: helix-turn-helix transcriptional regulator [Egibacteraceae bacterium]